MQLNLSVKLGRVIATDNHSFLVRRGWIFVLFFGVLVPLLGFGWLVVAVGHHERLAWDAAILKLFHGLATPGGDEIVSFVARSGRIEVVVVLAVIGVLVLKALRRLPDALFLTLAIVGVVVINLLFRAAFPRTHLASWKPLTPTFGSGFPSSQAADTFAIALAFALLTWPTRWRWPTIALGSLYALTVGLSRIYLGLHYPSDILAGWELSLAWVAAISFIRRVPFKL
jgi:membrane-associated phospholipid phosphatase